MFTYSVILSDWILPVRQGHTVSVYKHFC